MTANDLRQTRAAQNQSLFRRVNQQLVDLNQAFEPVAQSSLFVCECARIDCVQQLEMTLSEYEAARRSPVRFIVAPSADHVLPDVERVVEEREAYFVVEKIGQAADVAVRLASGS
jgi:hypothetical protein